MSRFGRSFPMTPVIKPPPAVAAVAFDAIGPGAYGSYATSMSMTHTATAGAYVIVDIVGDRAAGVSTCTYGGTAMTLLGTIPFGGSVSNGFLTRYGINGVPGGASTIAATLSATTWWGINAMSFLHVKQVGAATTVSGNSTAMSQAVTCGAGQMIAQAFGAANVFANPTITGSGGTTRYSNGTHSELCMSTATTSTTFTGSMGSAQPFGGLATVLS